MLIPHKGHTDTIQVYSVTVMTHVKALQAGHSSQGTSEPITPGVMGSSETSDVTNGSRALSCMFTAFWRHVPEPGQGIGSIALAMLGG